MAAKVVSPGSWADAMDSAKSSRLGRFQHRDSPVQLMRDESNAPDAFLPLSNLGDSNSASSNHSTSVDPSLDESSRQGFNLTFTSQLGLASAPPAAPTSLFRAVVSREIPALSSSATAVVPPVEAAASTTTDTATPAVSMDVEDKSDDARFAVVGKKRSGGPGAPRTEQNAPKNRKVAAERKPQPPSTPPAQTDASQSPAQQRVLRSASNGSKPASPAAPASPQQQPGAAPWAHLAGKSPISAATPLSPKSPASAPARPFPSPVASASPPFESPSSPVSAVTGTPPSRSAAGWSKIPAAVEAVRSPVDVFPPLSKSPQVAATSAFLAEPAEPEAEPRQRPQRQAALKNAAPRFQQNRRVAAKELPRETNEQRLAQREKQLSYGKLTVGYKRYIEMVPIHRRKRGDPMTPDKTQVCSKRSWDGQLCKWRRQLHSYDPPELAGSTSMEHSEADLNSSVDDDNGSTTSDAFSSPPHSPGRTERVASVSSEDAAPNVTDGLLVI
eukprot:TRINITY_DN8638_c0_g1_i1.p1 TRINITY_DN8638_c0_g1~~TRINITY_DN8638_c0_g1_i1.p1  ORF type:complete len:500 (+),score=125.91 TRINITY_DN8638_c0_g1_i1:119-1618(+)